MLGFITAKGEGASDRLIGAVAARLEREGLPLAGAVQVNTPSGAGQRCKMALRILPGQEIIAISQELGPLARGCRLDPGGLEQAVGLAAMGLEGARLLIVNKFGKQEVEGRGFRPLIEQALLQGVPVLTAVNPSHLEAFTAYAQGMAQELPGECAPLTAWCKAQGKG